VIPDTRLAYLGVDVGGTSIKSLLVGPDGFADERRAPTPGSDADGTATSAMVAAEAARAQALCRRSGWTLVGVGVVVPGLVDEEAGMCLSAVNLGWEQLPVRELLVRALVAAGIRTSVAFGQDVRAAALAESVAQALPGTTVFVPLGTGVACATIADGRIALPGPAAGEIGQLVLTRTPHRGLRVEDIASAGGLARRAGTATGRDAVDAARAGDPAAVAAWDDLVVVLADVLASVIATSAPRQLVLGGGLADAGSFLFRPLARALDARLPAALRIPLLPARLGDLAAAHGAVALARGARAEVSA
jgi:glucokinase